MTKNKQTKLPRIIWCLFGFLFGALFIGSIVLLTPTHTNAYRQGYSQGVNDTLKNCSNIEEGLPKFDSCVKIMPCEEYIPDYSKVKCGCCENICMMKNCNITYGTYQKEAKQNGN